MATIYILLVFTLGMDGRAMMSQEFTTKQKCEIARDAAIGAGTFTAPVRAVCVEK